MLTGGMASRDIPRIKLLSRKEILDARIIRGEGLSNAAMAEQTATASQNTVHQASQMVDQVGFFIV